MVAIRRAVVVLMLLALGVLGGVPAADAAWDDADAPALAVGADGTVLMAWARLLDDPAAGRIEARVRRPDGTMTAVAVIGSGARPQVAVAPDGRGVVVWRTARGDLEARTIDAAGVLGPTHTAIANAGADDPALEASAAGAVLVAASGARIVSVVMEPGAEKFGAPRYASDANGVAELPRLTLRDGDVLVGWSRTNGAETRVEIAERSVSQLAAADVPPSDVVAVSPAGATNWIDDVALDGQGRAIVRWGATHLKVRPVGGIFPSTAELIGGIGLTSAPLVVDGQGRAIAAWSGPDGQGQRVRAQARKPNGLLAPTQTLSATLGPGFYYATAAGNAAGQATVAWWTAGGPASATVPPGKETFAAPVNAPLPAGEDSAYRGPSSIAVGDSGATYIGFLSQDSKGHRALALATRPAGGKFSSTSVSNVVPVALETPSLEGKGGTAGATLSCDKGRWIGGRIKISYQWLRDGSAIGGATQSSYALARADADHTITCQVTAANDVGSASRMTAGRPVVQTPPAIKRVEIKARLHAGLRDRLRCVTKVDGSRVTLKYAWMRRSPRGLVGLGAGSRYVVRRPDVGASIMCQATAVNSGGTARASSPGVHVFAECEDTRDNDGDGKIDRLDRGCGRSRGSSESEQLRNTTIARISGLKLERAVRGVKVTLTVSANSEVRLRLARCSSRRRDRCAAWQRVAARTVPDARGAETVRLGATRLPSGVYRVTVAAPGRRPVRASLRVTGRP